jgi:hypothetical protein
MLPPGTPQVMLAGHYSSWAPAGADSSERRLLWATLRASLVYAVWYERCRRRRGHAAAGGEDGAEGSDGSGAVAAAARAHAAAIVEHVVTIMRGCMRRDWARVVEDPRTATSVCSSWFRGRDPTLSREDFEERWLDPLALAAQGSWCCIEGDRLRVVLSSQVPVALFPAQPAPAGVVAQGPVGEPPPA